MPFIDPEWMFDQRIMDLGEDHLAARLFIAAISGKHVKSDGTFGPVVGSYIRTRLLPDSEATTLPTIKTSWERLRALDLVVVYNDQGHHFLPAWFKWNRLDRAVRAAHTPEIPLQLLNRSPRFHHFRDCYLQLKAGRFALTGQQVIPVDTSSGNLQSPQVPGNSRPSTSTFTCTSTSEVPPIVPQPATEKRSAKRRPALPLRVEDLPPRCLEYWNAHPGREKDSPRRVLSAWDARIKEGVKHEDMILAAKNYRIKREGQDPQYTKGRASFIGPQACMWREYLVTEETADFKERAVKAKNLIEKWNTVGARNGWKLTSLGDVAIRMVAERLGHGEFERECFKAIDRIDGCTFLEGSNAKGYTPDLAWFVKYETLGKIMMGRFDGRGTQTQRSQNDDNAHSDWGLVDEVGTEAGGRASSGEPADLGPANG